MWRKERGGRRGGKENGNRGFRERGEGMMLRRHFIQTKWVTEFTLLSKYAYILAFIIVGDITLSIHGRIEWAL